MQYIYRESNSSRYLNKQNRVNKMYSKNFQEVIQNGYTEYHSKTDKKESNLLGNSQKKRGIRQDSLYRITYVWRTWRSINSNKRWF